MTIKSREDEIKGYFLHFRHNFVRAHLFPSLRTNAGISLVPSAESVLTTIVFHSGFYDSLLS